MPEKLPWEKVLEETLPRGELPPHFLLAQGQKMLWEKLLEIEALIKKLQQK
jgi:hypothetical protein